MPHGRPSLGRVVSSRDGAREPRFQERLFLFPGRSELLFGGGFDQPAHAEELRLDDDIVTPALLASRGALDRDRALGTELVAQRVRRHRPAPFTTRAIDRAAFFVAETIAEQP